MGGHRTDVWPIRSNEGPKVVAMWRLRAPDQARAEAEIFRTPLARSGLSRHTGARPKFLAEGWRCYVPGGGPRALGGTGGSSLPVVRWFTGDKLYPDTASWNSQL